MRQATGFISDAGNHFETEFDALRDDLRNALNVAIGNPPMAKQATDAIVADLTGFAGMLGHMASLAPPAVAEASHNVTSIETDGLPVPVIEDSNYDELRHISGFKPPVQVKSAYEGDKYMPVSSPPPSRKNANKSEPMS